MIQGGLPRDKILVKPNFIHPDPGDKGTTGNYALYAGRLSQEKGIHTLLNSWKNLRGIPLKILGDGQQRKAVEALIAKNDLRDVEVLGWKPHSEVIAAMKSARFLVYPSETYETFSLAIVEGFACGLPAIASRLGATAEVVSDGNNGLLFEVGDADDLAAKVDWAWTHPAEFDRMGQAGRLEFKQKYTADHNYQSLMKIYRTAIDSRPGLAGNQAG
jgi:glycosyltransferase involved in cell wall biosynthesis